MTERQNEKERIFLRMAKVAGEASTCARDGRKFGAILVNKGGRIKGHGYNGTVSGSSNRCGGGYCLRDSYDCNTCQGDGWLPTINPPSTCPKCGGNGKIEPIVSGTNNDIGCIHAEVNLIINSERRDLAGGTVYVNGEPCELCAKLLAQCRINRLVGLDGGYSTKEGLRILRQHGVEVVMLDE